MSSRSSVNRALPRCSGGHGYESCLRPRHFSLAHGRVIDSPITFYYRAHGLLFKAQKITSATISVCQDGFKFYYGVFRWISFILNSLIRWTSNHDNFSFSTPTFAIVTWYFCCPRNVCNMIPLFFQKQKGRYDRFFPAREKWNNVINLWKKI